LLGSVKELLNKRMVILRYIVIFVPIIDLIVSLELMITFFP